nr:J domain-containing protein [Halomarina salina]
MAVLLTLFAVLLEPLALLLAVPFGVVAYLMWYQASGRLVERVYASVERRARIDDRGRTRRTRRETAEADGGRGGFGAGPRDARSRTASGRGRRRRATGQERRAGDQRRRRQRRPPEPDPGPTPREAYGILDLDPSADQSAVRRAYRERVKETHPDRGGDEEEFKRVTAAYERLSE